jgi:hypothetical protein
MALVWGSVVPGQAAIGAQSQSSQYFSMIQDLPLMPGLVELTDQAFVFDKPQGRILESAVLSQGPSRTAIWQFYQASLPALGWQLSGTTETTMLFSRDDEFLQIRSDNMVTNPVVRFLIGPAAAP